MSLIALQSRMQAWLAGETAAPPMDDVLGEAEQRLGVYHHAYRARLGDLLRDLYDKTWSYLGDEAFNHSVLAFIEATPSTSRSLDDYGAGFPAMLAAHWPTAPEAAELAQLEWDMRRAFDGPDAEPVAGPRLAALSSADWDQARLSFHPTLVVRPAGQNVGALWSVLEAGAGATPEPLAAPMAIRVWRRDLQPSFRMIEALEATALNDLAAGETFAAICARTLKVEGAAGLDRLSVALARWLEDGLVIAVG